MKRFTPTSRNNGIDAHLTGDISDAGHLTGGLDPVRIAPDNVDAPEFGDLGDISDASELTGDTLMRLSNPGLIEQGSWDMLGHGGEVGALMSQSPVSQRSFRPTMITRGAGATQPTGTRPSPSRLGTIAARAVLERNGIGSKGQQDGILETAIGAANLNALGRKSAGLLNPEDALNFVNWQKGRLLALKGIRETAGMRAHQLRFFLQQQQFILPYRIIAASGIPVVGGTIDLTPALPAIDTDYPIFGIAVLIGTTNFQRNDAKVLNVALRTGTGGVYNRSVWNLDMAYSNDGNAAFVGFPAVQSEGEYFPQMLTARRDTVPANTRNVGITLTNNDGVADTATVIALGFDSEYVRQLLKRLY